MLNYSAILHRLLSVNIMGGIKLGLKNCLDLDSLLGNPSQAFNSIHIAGTNGKGSVSNKIAAACRASGLKVGLYTSPHISCFRERIQINGEMISEKKVQEHVNTLFTICDKQKIPATFFELTTLLAFMHFAAEKVDFAILETGLGGRLDATNIAKSCVSVITSISLEHTEILGKTIELITLEKAGIIKPLNPVIIGPRVSKSIIDPIAKQNGSMCIQITGSFEDFNEENNAIARKAMEIIHLPVKAIEIGLKACPPCRLEIFPSTKLAFLVDIKTLPDAVVLDVAHNPDGLKHLLKAIQKHYPARPLRFVIGLSKNKDIEECLRVIKDAVTAFHLIEGRNERALPKKILAEHFKSLNIDKDRIIFEQDQSISSTILNAIQLAGQNNEILVVCGTFFIMSEARQILGVVEEQDPTDMNER